MPIYLYVDNSNVWIEGKYVSAVSKKLASDVFIAHSKGVIDQTWKIDFGKLHAIAGGGITNIARAILYGSRPPKNDSLWAAAKHNGFEIVVHDRAYGKEKKVDGNVMTDMMADSFTKVKVGTDEITLVAGDADYVPTIQNIVGRGIIVNVAFWDHAATELKQVCSKVISLNPHLAELTL